MPSWQVPQSDKPPQDEPIGHSPWDLNPEQRKTENHWKASLASGDPQETGFLWFPEANNDRTYPPGCSQDGASHYMQSSSPSPCALMITSSNRGHARGAMTQATWVLLAPGASTWPCVPRTCIIFLPVPFLGLELSGVGFCCLQNEKPR